MIPRRVLAPLVFGLPVLVVAFAVIMAGRLLAEGLGDAVAVRALGWVACTVLMLFAADAALVCGILGFQALSEADLRERGAPSGASDDPSDDLKS
ncbi:MAG: hypothetical protein U0935_25070 [Pirellulales bacterium]